jgi:hypothetical protein
MDYLLKIALSCPNPRSSPRAKEADSPRAKAASADGLRAAAASAEEQLATSSAAAAASAASAASLQQETETMKANVAAGGEALRASVAAETGRLLARAKEAEERAGRAEGEAAKLRARGAA